MAPAVIDAGVAALEADRVHAVRHRNQTNAVGLGPLAPDFAGRECLHRRHRIGLPRRPPRFLRFGIAGDADVRRDFVVERRDILISDRPIVPAIVLAFHLEIGRQIAGKLREVMQRRAADRIRALIGVGKGMFAAEQYRAAGGLEPPAPNVRADQIRQLPVGAVVEHDDFLAGFGEHRRIDRPRCAGADDDGINFFVGHGGHHFFVGAMWGM